MTQVGEHCKASWLYYKRSLTWNKVQQAVAIFYHKSTVKLTLIELNTDFSKLQNESLITHLSTN